MRGGFGRDADGDGSVAEAETVQDVLPMSNWIAMEDRCELKHALLKKGGACWSLFLDVGQRAN